MRVLDLFCGAGGAAMGLHWAWPDAEIVGVDIKPQPRYPFKFVQGDVLDHFDAASAHLCGFDFVWASPPCQRYSCVTPKGNRDNHPDLIGVTQAALMRSEVPFVIENVFGARHKLRNWKMLCGTMFGLDCRRHRVFETNFAWNLPDRQCDHSVPPLLVTTAGANSRKIGNFKSVKNAVRAYDIDWMDGNGLKEAIPPAYSHFIARQFRKG